MENKIKLVLFDLDGVLVDACDWHFHALNRALEETAQWWIGREEHESTYNGLPTRTKLEKLVKKGIISKNQIEEIAALKQKKVIEIIESQCRFDSSKVSMCEDLQNNGIRVGCVTNSIRKTTEMMLEKIGIINYMDVIITNQDVVNPKPNPTGYILAGIRLGIQTENIAIVEDSPKGIQAAKDSNPGLLIEVKNAEQVNSSLMRTHNIIPTHKL